MTKGKRFNPVHERDAQYFLRDIKAMPLYPPKFLKWLENNMPIWDAFCEVIRDAKKKGYEKFSARAAVHILRWRLYDKFENGAKIPNDFTPYMGRLFNFMYCTHDETGFITTRPTSREK